MSRVLALLLVLPLLGGCLVRTAADVVTAPVRAGAKVVDWTTTSQSEADRNRGRRERKAEAKQAREQRRQQQEAEREARREQRGD
jgi:hypothetical protein